MKISFFVGLFTLISIYSCNEIPRKNAGNWNFLKDPVRENNIQETEDIKEEKKEITKIESILMQDFKLRFKGVIRNGRKWGYKVQVPKSVNKKYLLRVLEDFEIIGNRILGKIGNTKEELKYKGELDIKVEAVKYFLENHDRDQTLFISLPVAPPQQAQASNTETQDPKDHCSNLSGIYWETGKEYTGESIEITKVNCNNFKLKQNNQNHYYDVSFYKNFKCSSIGSYALCTKGIKIDNNLINLFINEKWLHTGCDLKKNITIDISRGILNSGVTYHCKDSSKNYSRLIEYQLNVE
ncbi:MAG: hypothetical protein DRQ88_00705 [Epsilonproteobacteria bacterium]|nr:MAG: hypothetical protein DRQ89_10240 [Campylobacterota bacterium]RLA68156.1 MAG: hypothetical protein DRQ88_00705 [Campylobacterota bacterium]